MWQKLAFINENTLNTFQNGRGLKYSLNEFEIKQYIQFLVYPSELITQNDKRKLNNFLHKIDLNSSYEESNINGRDQFRFLRELAEIIVEQNISSIDNILGNFSNKSNTENGYDNDALIRCMGYVQYASSGSIIFTEADIDNIKQDIAKKTRNITLIQYAPELSNMSVELNSQGVDLDKVSDKYLSIFEKAINEIRDAQAETTETESDFIIGKTDPNNQALVQSKDNIAKFVSLYQRPSNRLRSGIKQLNNLINGGFEGSRVYTFAAPPKRFKSGILLNLAISIAKYNGDYKPKNPKLKPLVLYLSMENSAHETANRIYKYITGDPKGFTNDNINKNDAAIVLDNYLNDSDVYIGVAYRNSAKYTTSLLDDLYAQYKAKGFEIICVVQDYLRRINSNRVEVWGDMRLNMGAVMDEFEIFAKTYEIPVITAAQLNRRSYEILENYANMGRTDAAKELNLNQIADSNLIVENTDYMFIINREELFNKVEWQTALPNIRNYNRSYLSIKMVVSRDSSAMNGENKAYFDQPFENEMKLVDDCNMPDDQSVAVFSLDKVRNEVVMQMTIDERNALTSKGLIVTGGGESQQPGNAFSMNGMNNSPQPTNNTVSQPAFNSPSQNPFSHHTEYNSFTGDQIEVDDLSDVFGPE